MAAIRSLWRWHAWRLAWTDTIPKWHTACIWDIPAEDNVFDVPGCLISRRTC